MPQAIDIHHFIEKAEHLSVIDVRSEGEFAHGHIPGAINIPLFSNEERAQVGTVYKQQGREQAILLGLRLIGPKLEGFVTKAGEQINGKEVLIHCWRGGMRSGSFAWLLETAGFTTYTLKRGYKAYRQLVLESFTEPRSLILLGGKTGSGKTRILQFLREKGEQVIDLEGLCNHKGSSFGAIGQDKQPTTEQFENDLFDILRFLEPSRPIWLEDESKNVGSVFIPDGLWQQMRSAPLVFIEVDKQIRVANLVEDYASHDTALLGAAILRIKKRLGGLNFREAMEALERKDFAMVADLCLTYYDKAYLRGLNDRENPRIRTIEFNSFDADRIADSVIEEANILTHGTDIRN